MERLTHDLVFLALAAEAANQLPYGAVAVDEEGIVRWANPFFEKSLLEPPGGLVGRLLWDFIHPDDVEPTRQTFAQTGQAALKGEKIDMVATEAEGYVNRYRRSDGTYAKLRWFSGKDDTVMEFGAHRILFAFAELMGDG